MCLEKDIVIIAIFGKSCTGKTKVADSLAKLMNITVRHCSEEVINRAKQLNCSPYEMYLEEHFTVDRKTREIASAINDNYIIEGCFLPYVLCAISNIFWVELLCDDVERDRRHKERQKLEQEKQIDLRTRDVSDELLCQKLYRFKKIGSQNIAKIDTTSKSVEKIASFIASIVKV